MKRLVVLLMVSVMATSAFAIVDPDPNMVGIYFDIDANTNCVTSIGAPILTYAILTNPTAPSIEGIEMTYENRVPVGFEGLLYQLSFSLPPSAIDVGLDTRTPLGGDIIAGLGTPLPTTEATILVTWEYLPLQPFAVELFLRGVASPSIAGELPVMQSEGQLFQVGLSTGGADIPVATINMECPVATVSDTWGGVKSLYR